MTVVFEDNVDIYLARQVVLERVLGSARTLAARRDLHARAEYDRAWRSLSVLSR